MGIQASITAIGLAAGIGMAAPVCDLVFQACPGRFDGKTITVPEETIWISPTVAACDDTLEVRTPGAASPPSIVFIIDNSGSMSKGEENTSSGGNDPDEARFTVVQSLLDTLYAASPAAEVGMVLFTRRLAFDHRDNSYFRSAFPGDTSQHDSFVPLTPLNRIFPDGVRGLDTLKRLLEFSGNGNLIHHTRRAGSRENEDYAPTSTRDGTDITLGFEAAKVAMADAKAPPADRYFIFLSDGEPASLDEGRDPMEDDFIAGKSIPTTFTVYFKKGDNPTAPRNIVRMTENIRANGYSASNPKSNHWAINIPGSQLSALLQSSVLDTILSSAASAPKSATLQAGGITLTDTGSQAGVFTFPKRVPLSPDKTTIVFTYTHSVIEAGMAREVRVPYTVDIRRSGGAPALSQGLATACREPAALSLYSEGRRLSRIAADNALLEARLSLPAGESCANCSVQARASKATDRETFGLAPGTGYFSASFSRAVNPQPVTGNGVFEHFSADSLILEYVHPENPLDRTRAAYPYAESADLKVGFHNQVARGPGPASVPAGMHWILTAPESLQPRVGDPIHCCAYAAGSMTAPDSLRHTGVTVEAGGPFRADIRVFSNLGQFVNRLILTVPEEEYAKLEPGAGQSLRKLGILWSGRAGNGALAGTGAYVYKTEISLLRKAEGGEPKTWTGSRVFGLLRE